MARILIIDDDDSFREMLREFLEGNGYDITVAPDGEGIIQLCHEIKPDLVITDLFMPSGGISNVTDILKEFSKLKIIAVSGGNVVSKDYLELTKTTTRVFCVMHKPFAMNEMLKAVKECLSE